MKYNNDVSENSTLMGRCERVPDDWKSVDIKHLFNVFNGSTPKSTEDRYWGGDISWITPADMNEAKFIENSSRYITKDGFDSCNLTMADPGDIILSCRAPIGSVNLAAIPLCTNQGCKTLKPKGGVDTPFYYYYLSSHSDFLNSLGRGTTFMELSTSDLCNLMVPFPPLEVQKKISNHLDVVCSKTDLLTTSQKELIDKLLCLRQSIISETVTRGLNQNASMKDSGIQWIGLIPDNWNIVSIKSRFKINKRIAGRLGYDVLSVTQNGVKIKDISSNDGQLSSDYSKYQLVYKGDFVMNHMDLLTGFVDCSQFDGVTSPDYRVFTLESDDLLPRYALYILQMGYRNRIFYGMGQGVSSLGRWRLPREQFLNFEFPLPPLDVQESIVSYLDSKCKVIDSLISECSESISEFNEFKQSLIYEYVTGKRSVLEGI